jgi:hypothetical protein
LNLIGKYDKVAIKLSQQPERISKAAKQKLYYMEKKNINYVFSNFCKIADVNKCYFRARVNNEELISFEVLYFSSNRDKYIVDLLFIVFFFEQIIYC